MEHCCWCFIPTSFVVASFMGSAILLGRLALPYWTSQRFGGPLGWRFYLKIENTAPHISKRSNSKLKTRLRPAFTRLCFHRWIYFFIHSLSHSPSTATILFSPHQTPCSSSSNHPQTPTNFALPSIFPRSVTLSSCSSSSSSECCLCLFVCIWFFLTSNFLLLFFNNRMIHSHSHFQFLIGFLPGLH